MCNFNSNTDVSSLTETGIYTSDHLLMIFGTKRISTITVTLGVVVAAGEIVGEDTEI